MEILTIENLCKTYPKFQLKNVSFQMEQGSIMGFIGRNGAGKTTTLKSLQNLVHPDSGTITFFGKDLYKNEKEIKQETSFALGGANYYQRKKLHVITEVYRKFFKNWDHDLYQQYLQKFNLDEDKKIIELSEGMKVKYALALALSHHAKLLLLDEPTSGLDPVSRDEILEIFLDLVRDGKTSILFSTQITSDLEKCADTITYIKNGEIIASEGLNRWRDSYRLVKGHASQLPDNIREKLIGYRERDEKFTALALTQDINKWNTIEVLPADLESIMIYIERE